MIFENVGYHANLKTGEDALGNPIFEPVLIGTYQSAITQWKTEEIAFLGSGVTQTTRKLLTQAPIEVLKQVDYIIINGIKYNQVEFKSDFKRWRLCYVKEFKL